MTDSLHARLKGNFVLPLAGILVVALCLGTLMAYFLEWVRPEALRYSNGQAAVLKSHQAMIDQETAIRGWLLTANPTYLAPYTTASGVLASANHEAQLQLRSDVSVSAQLSSMVSAQQQWLNTWAIPAARSPITPATLSPAFMDEGKQLFDAYRSAETTAEADIGKRRTDLSQLAGQLLTAAFLLTLVVGLAMVLLAATQSRRLRRTILEPVADIVQTAERLATHDLWARARTDGPAEFTRIALGLNGLAEALAADRATLAAQQVAALAETEERATAEERQRLARDLHDSISQTLFSITMQTRAAQLTLAKQPSPSPAMAAYLCRLQELTQGAFAEMRALIFELRPGALQDEGLASALRKQAEGMAARDGISVTVGTPEAPLVLAPATEEDLYRIAQEALHNAVKHAAAARIHVLLAPPGSRTDGLVLEISDDGRGFERTADPRPGHLGLGTMAQRALRLGGNLEVLSSVGSGTSVRVFLPPQFPARDYGPASPAGLPQGATTTMANA